MSRYFDLVQQSGIGEVAFAGKERTHVSANGKAAQTELGDYRSRSASFSGQALDLVQRIFLVPAENAPRVVVFAPVNAQRSGYGFCLSIAETLVQVSRRKVCLVEANFRESETYGISTAPYRHGLADALAGEEPISIFFQPMAKENLSLLPSGTLDANSPSLITPDAVKSRFIELRASFDFVIVHAAPLALYAETIILSRVADGVALLLQTGSTRREDASAAVANLRALNIPVVAAVLDGATSPSLKKFLR